MLAEQASKKEPLACPRLTHGDEPEEMPVNVQQARAADAWAAHNVKMAAKAAMRADPAARAAKIAAINAPILQRHRTANLTALAAELAARKGREAADDPPWFPWLSRTLRGDIRPYFAVK